MISLFFSYAFHFGPPNNLFVYQNVCTSENKLFTDDDDDAEKVAVEMIIFAENDDSINDKNNLKCGINRENLVANLISSSSCFG